MKRWDCYSLPICLSAMRYLYVLLLPCLLVLSGCTSMVLGGGQQAGVHAQQDDRSLEQITQCAEITQNVRQVVGGSGDNISVSTENGIVTLQGSVASQREIQRLISRVYRVNGVQGVDSRLAVGSP